MIEVRLFDKSGKETGLFPYPSDLFEIFIEKLADEFFELGGHGCVFSPRAGIVDIPATTTSELLRQVRIAESLQQLEHRHGAAPMYG